MGSPGPVSWLRELCATFATTFGPELTLARAGDGACWSFDGQSVLVREGRVGTVEALFLDRPALDAVSALPAVAAYRPRASYSLDRAGCSRMVEDAIAFFSGTREPRFAFAAAQVLDRAR